jgi:uncharacterized protein
MFLVNFLTGVEVGLMNLILRPTPRFSHEKRGIYEDPLRTKDWTASWPLLRKAQA